MATKKALSSAKQTLVVFGLRESIHKTFGKYLASSVLGFNVTKTETRFHYLVPPMLCQPLATCSTNESPSSSSNTTLASETFPSNYLSTSACLAILDDLSSFACMAGDRTHRTGVSLSLSVDLIHPCRMTALSEVDVLCKIDKIGRYVGFLTVEFIDRSNGQVLARGSHNKFLPTGFLWETLLSKRFFPLGFWLFQKYAGPHKYSTPIDFLFPDRNVSPSAAREMLLTSTKPEALTRPLGSIWDLFPFESLNATATNNSHHTHNITNSNNDNLDNNTFENISSQKTIYSYETLVVKATKNYVGLMHGGAVGSAIERACQLARQQQLETMHKATTTTNNNETAVPPLPTMIIDAMEVRYLSANKGKLLIEVWDDQEATQLPVVVGSSQPCPSGTVSSRSMGVVKDKLSGKINVQFICHWRLL